MSKILFKNGIVVNSSKSKKLDLLVSGEKIIKLAPKIKATSDMEVIDCRGKYLFPGFIDGHTHFDLSVAGTTTIDNFESGTRAAVSGGTTTIIDYGTQYKGETLEEGLANWLNKAKDGVSCDYGIHMSISDWNEEAKEQVSLMIKAGVTSFKLYTTYDVKLEDKDLFEAMQEISKCGGITGVHCENDGMIAALRSEVKKEDDNKVKMHPLTRPDVAEAESVNKIVYYTENSGCPYIAVHVTNKKALDELKIAKDKKLQVYVETCPQYLYFDDSVYNGKFESASKFVCAPPIRKKSDSECLWKGIKSGLVDIVSTDHCSFTMKQKELGIDDFRKIPGGVNLVEYRGILLFDAVMKKKIKLEDMARVLSENPSYLFGLYDRKGFLKKGYDADIVIINPKKKTKLSIKSQVSKSDYCLFEGKNVNGGIENVFLRGQKIVESGKVVNEKKGMYLKRKKYKKI
jgi:dihydropyrimidinase